MALTPQEVLKLSQQGPLSTAQVKQLATPQAPVQTPTPVTPVAPVQPTSTTINTANLSTPATPITPTVPQQPVITTPAIPQALIQTGAEQGAFSGADASLKRIADYKAQLAGQSAFTEQQKAQQDIIGKQAVQTQYTNQLNQAKQEAQGIQLQLQTTLQQQQESARGQGVTAGGLAPHLRATQTTANQALLSNAIKQYGIGASLAAAQGDLASALDYVDQAVKLQFDPITANLEAELANLEAIRGSSAYSAADKKQALATEYQVKQELADKETEKKDAETIYGLALQASQNGADPAIVSNIMKSGSLEKALQTGTGWFGTSTAAAIQEYTFAKKNGYKGSFSDYQNEDANRKIAVAKAGVSNTFGLTPNQVFTATQALKKTVATNTQASRELQRQASILNSTWERLASGQAVDLNATSQAIITTFNKLLDPTSVVREAEYDRSASGQALISTIQGKLAAIEQGGPGLTKQSLKEIVDLGNLYAKNAQASIDATVNGAREEANYFGLNADLVTAPPSGTQTATPQKQVEQAVQSSGKTYQQIISGAPKGQIAVVQDGIAGYIPAEEFDPNTQVRM